LEKLAQIEQMDLVYTGVAATIIAAEGQDPNDGLPGVSLPRQPIRSFKIRQTSRYVSSMLDDGFDKRKWGTRAWTYQGELSSRSLVFLNDSVYVECRKGLLGAAFESPRAVPFSSNFKNYDISDGDDSALNCIWEHIAAYSSRSLSYPEDIVNAITGIFKFRSQDPTTCLSSLLWRNYNSHNTVSLSQRRQGYPSWSWLGITGSTSTPNTRSMQKSKYYMCTKIQAILEDVTTTVPGTSVRTSSKSGLSMLPIQELAARDVCIKDLQFQHQPSVEGQPTWEVQFLPGHKFLFDVLSIQFFPDLNDADMGTGKNFKALLLFFYDSGQVLSPNKGYQSEPNGYELQLLVLNQSTTKKTGAWERVGAMRLFAHVPDKGRTKEGIFRRLEQSGCVNREEMVLR
jgi:Heterokaryon incompatibility protein (HET)